MKKVRQILALSGVILLAALYILTLCAAIFDSSHEMFLFKFSIMYTILLPILLWGYTVIYRLAKGKQDEELIKTLEKMKEDSQKKNS